MGKKFAAILSTIALSSTALVTALIGAVGLSGLWAVPAGADTVAVPLSCLVSNVPVIGSQTATRNQGISTTTVTHVYQNDTFSVAISPSPGNESADLGSGATLRTIRNLHYRTTVPANSQLVGSATLSPGSGLNSTPSISQTGTAAGSTIEVTVPGPINAGTNYQLPTVNMTLRATGTALSVIQPRIAGSSYADWGLSMTVNADLPSGLGNADLPLNCFPGSSLALSTTTIWPTDTSPPSISVTSPADGASYAQGAVVNAAFTCNDGPFGTGAVSCSGAPTQNGFAVDTASIGPHTLTVTSTDNAGNVATPVVVSYTVSDDPSVVAKGGWADEAAGGQVPFTIRLFRPADETTTVSYATQDGTATAADDYTAITGTATFLPGGSQVQTVNVTLKNDAIFEPTESFSLKLISATNALIATPSTTGRIRDDEVPAVRVEGGTAIEGAGQIPFKVSIEGPTRANVAVNYATSDGTSPNHATAGADYTASSGSLTFVPGGPLVQIVNVPTIGDTVFEADAEQFTFTANNSAVSQTASGPGTIVDDEAHPPVVSIGNAKLVEGDLSSKVLTFTVSLDRVSSAPVTTRYSTAAGTATAGSDFTPQINKQLVIEAGKTFKVVRVPVFGDTANEGDETFTVTLFNNFASALGIPTATGTIIDDDAPTATLPTIAVGDATVVEGDSLTTKVTATVSLSIKPVTTVTVRLTASGGTATALADYL
ncbi:MAG: Calx-beta domain-containing protein, partial [Acidimicrobiia bacterium]